MKNMTYAQAIDNAINGNINDEVIERLEALKEQLAKRGSGKHGPTKTQKENEELKTIIIENLRAEVEGMTATEVGNSITVTCQKASAILRQMVEAGVVRKDKVGKVVRFYAVD
jgi:Fic family protein